MFGIFGSDTQANFSGTSKGIHNLKQNLAAIAADAVAWLCPTPRSEVKFGKFVGRLDNAIKEHIISIWRCGVFLSIGVTTVRPINLSRPTM